jgi:hypothetical protein
MDERDPLSRKILQIIPADTGWRAVYEKEEPTFETELSRLVAWALVEDPQGEREVVGLIVDPSDSTRLTFADAPPPDIAGELQRYGYKGA